MPQMVRFGDREKVIRCVEKDDSPTSKGYQLYRNHIRPHMALEGKTLAEVCGIKVEGESKRKTLIENASKKGKTKSLFDSDYRIIDGSCKQIQNQANLCPVAKENYLGSSCFS